MMKRKDKKNNFVNLEQVKEVIYDKTGVLIYDFNDKFIDLS